mgnify:CR=1 FL=1
MVSLSVMVGINPHLRVFIFASPDTCNNIINTLHKASPEIETLTPEEELNELSTLTRLGCITTIIVADYPSPAQTDGSVLEGLTNAIHIIVIEEYETTGLASVVFHSFIQERTWRNIPFDRLSIIRIDKYEALKCGIDKYLRRRKYFTIPDLREYCAGNFVRIVTSNIIHSF